MFATVPLLVARADAFDVAAMVFWPSFTEHSGLLVDLVSEVSVSNAVGATDKWLMADCRSGVA